MPNLAAIHEAISDAVPDRECLIFRDRRLSYAEVQDRTRRLAEVLRGHGLGAQRERSALAGWESGQDHVALYLHNGNEYLEGMLGAFKARCAPFNVNYRYVEEELLYLFEDSGAHAIVYHAAFAPVLAAIRERLSGVRVWLQVEDGSGEPLLPGALDYESALAAAKPAPPSDLSPDDLYMLYTGGTTGMPKGVLWRQHDIFRAALSAGRPDAEPGELAARARERRGLRALPTPPFMHGAAHWSAFSVWHGGGTVIVQSQPSHLDPDDVWSTVEHEGVELLLIVGDAFARPLLDGLETASYDLSSLRNIITGGAILSATLKDALLKRIPQARIVDTLGSSESGSQALQVTKAGGRASTGEFEMNADNLVLSEDMTRVLLRGDKERGWLARTGDVPLGYLGDPEKTARTFPLIDGARYAVPGDRASLGPDGSLLLHGRDSITINSGGEKIFAEEVELALKHHSGVYDAVVVGTPSDRWGQQVTAVVRLRDGERADEESLRAVCREHIAAYKLPKVFVFVDAIERAPSGKPDYAWARRAAAGDGG
jgi:fatty-acyl-CoA synthase